MPKRLFDSAGHALYRNSYALAAAARSSHEKCSVEGCTAPWTALGLCSRHYAQSRKEKQNQLARARGCKSSFGRRYKKPLRDIPPRRTYGQCKTPECSRLAVYVHGWCAECNQTRKRARLLASYRRSYHKRTARARATGLCHDCTGPSDGASRCAACKALCAARERKRRADALALGLCARSGCRSLHGPLSTYCDYHKEQRTAVRRKLHHSRPERNTVYGHIRNIKEGLRTYAGMPIFDGWDPARGGSCAAGEKWIIDNLGYRPTEGKWHLHIIDRRIGFVPNNLVWVPVDRHRQEEMLSKTLRELKTLRDQLASR